MYKQPAALRAHAYLAEASSATAWGSEMKGQAQEGQSAVLKDRISLLGVFLSGKTRLCLPKRKDTEPIGNSIGNSIEKKSGFSRYPFYNHFEYFTIVFKKVVMPY